MNKPVRVRFLSSVVNPDRKWYQQKKLMHGDELAQALETLINDQLHEGFRFVRTEAAYVEYSKVSGDGMSGHDYSVPLGMLVFFEAMN